MLAAVGPEDCHLLSQEQVRGGDLDVTIKAVLSAKSVDSRLHFILGLTQLVLPSIAF